MNKTKSWTVRVEFRRGLTGGMDSIEFTLPNKREATAAVKSYKGRKGITATMRKVGAK